MNHTATHKADSQNMCTQTGNILEMLTQKEQWGVLGERANMAGVALI